MDTLSSFINRRVKSVDELTITKLIEKCGMSKAKFYRCLSQPFRFSDTELETIARELRLNSSDTQKLYEYRDGDRSGQESTDTADEDKKNINRVIENIVLGRIKTDTDHHNRIYKLFHCGDKDEGLQIRSAAELVQMLSDFFVTDSQGKQPPLFEALIFNSYSEHASRNLSALVDALGRHRSFLENYRIEFSHLIDDRDMETDSRFEALLGLYRIASVSTYCCYHMAFADLKDTFLGNTDCCLVHFTDNKQRDCYLLFNFVREDEVSIYAFFDCNLYSYLSYQYTSLKAKFSASTPPRMNPVEVSNYVIDRSGTAGGILLTYAPCYDNIIPELWNGPREKYLNDPDRLRSILLQLDPSNSLAALPHRYLIDKLVESFHTRFRIAEESGRPTILSAAGLREFSETGTTSEMNAVGIRFTDAETLDQLRYLHSRLGTDHAPGQSYYLINDDFTPPDTSLLIFDHTEIGMYFHKDIRSSVYWVILQHPEIASEFFRYLSVDLTDPKARSQHKPILLSDERAGQYIQMLIDQVESRMDSGSASN